MTTNLTQLDLWVLGVPFVIIVTVTHLLRRYTRSVADFLAASRCAGRYVICTAIAETGSTVMGVMVGLEVFSRTGFSLRYWESFGSIVSFVFGLLGLIIYRYRETRALTFHQFFEMRYSKGLRVFASFLNVFSGIFNFGIQPAVGARFFVYFCGLPEHMSLGFMTVPTFMPLMVCLMAVSLYFALSGGQISVMVTDCLENVISSIFYFVVAVFIICTVSVSQMREALTSGEAGKSFINPFDIGGRTEFNGWYVVFGLILSIYYYRGSAWNQGFAAAAKSPHEARMATILANWRYYAYNAMMVLVSIAAFVTLHHADFAPQQEAVQRGLEAIGSSQLQTQMRMPMALGVLLAPGVKGAFLAVVFFGLLASQGVQLHNYGGTIMQDVLLPLRKREMDATSHVLWLRGCIFFVAAFACVFSALFKPVDYLVMIVQLIGAIYLGGVGVVVWGGLYWRRGSTAGAWAALIIGSTLGVTFNLVQQFWTNLNPALQNLFGPGGFTTYLAAHPEHCPLNGQQLTIITALSAGLSYVIISLLGRAAPFPLEKMLHRDIPKTGTEQETAIKRFWLARFLDIDEHFTPGDKRLAYGTVIWSVFWQLVAIGILIWSVSFHPPSTEWWFEYTMVTGVWLTAFIGIIVTVWFTIGVTRDLFDLFRTLKNVVREDNDDGTVREKLKEGA